MSSQRKWTDCVSVRQRPWRAAGSCGRVTVAWAAGVRHSSAARTGPVVMLPDCLQCCWWRVLSAPVTCSNLDARTMTCREECMKKLKWKARWLDTHFVQWPWLQKGALWGWGSVGACGGMHGCWSGCWLEEDLRQKPRSVKKMHQQNDSNASLTTVSTVLLS